MRTASPATASTLRTVSQVSTLATLLGARVAGTVGITGAIDRTRQHELHHADGEAGVVTDGCESEGVPSGAGVLGPRGSSVAAAAPIGVAPAAAATMTRVVASRRIGYQIVVGMPISRRRVSRSKSASRRGVASALGAPPRGVMSLPAVCTEDSAASRDARTERFDRGPIGRLQELGAISSSRPV